MVRAARGDRAPIRLRPTGRQGRSPTPCDRDRDRRLRRSRERQPSVAELHVAQLAAEIANLPDELNTVGRSSFRSLLRQSMRDDHTLVPLFHLVRTAAMQRARGFEVSFAGLCEDAPFDLLISRAGAEAEVACDIISAEEGRCVHRGAWFRLADRVDPDLQTWLMAHPGRYLLKMMLPHGLQDLSEQGDTLAQLHGRIRAMLDERRRSDSDAAVMLRLDPLLLTAAQADELGLMSSLRSEFGPEAHLSVTAAGAGVFAWRPGQAGRTRSPPPSGAGWRPQRRSA